MDKKAKIQRLIEMQKQFSEKEQNEGVSMADYFAPEGESSLGDYRQEYRDLAMDIVDEAHKEVGSKQ